MQPGPGPYGIFGQHAGRELHRPRPGSSSLAAPLSCTRAVRRWKPCSRKPVRLGASSSAKRTSAPWSPGPTALRGRCSTLVPGKPWKSPSWGAHQLRNAAVVLTAVDCLIRRGWSISEERIFGTVSGCVWPGRFELLRRNPDVIVDGGHNPQCLEALAQNVRDYLAGRNITALTGVMADKDYTHMYETMAPLVTRFVAVTPDNPVPCRRRS